MFINLFFRVFHILTIIFAQQVVSIASNGCGHSEL